MHQPQPQPYISPQQAQSLQEQRMARLQKYGFKGPTGSFGPMNENVNGAVHDPRIRQKFGDVLGGAKRHMYREMFGGQSGTGDVSDRSKLEKEKGAKPVPGQFAEMERLLDPDRGMSMSMGAPNTELSMDTIQGRDFSMDLQAALAQRQSQQQQMYIQQQQMPQQQMYMQQQMPQQQMPPQQMPPQNTLSLDQFVGGPQVPEVPQMAESTPQQRGDYQAYANYMYGMNEGIIREIAQAEAEKMVKSVLSEHIKAERSKYAFERVTFEKNGKKIELLKKDDKYYRLKPVQTEAGEFTALQEVKIKRKKKV